MVDPWAYFLWALLLLTLPLHWVLAAVAAAGVHEACHLAALRALGGRVLSFHIGVTGAVMETALSGRGRQCLAALAGPAGSLLLVLTGRWLPHVAVCGLVQGLFNLLPIYPLDGGRILRCFLDGPGAWAIEGLGALLLVIALGRISLPLAIFLLMRGIFVKIPCKRRKIGVQ